MEKINQLTRCWFLLYELIYHSQILFLYFVFCVGMRIISIVRTVVRTP